MIRSVLENRKKSEAIMKPGAPAAIKGLRKREEGAGTGEFLQGAIVVQPEHF